MVSFKPLVILSSFSVLAWWISYGTLLFMWGDSMPKQTACRAEKKCTESQHHNSEANPGSSEFTTRWDRQDVEQIKKTPRESPPLNQWRAGTCEILLHDVAKAQCVFLARLERGGLEPESSVPLSDISAAGPASASIASSWRRRRTFIHLSHQKSSRKKEGRNERWGVMGPNKEQRDGATKSEPCQSHSCVAGPCSSEQPLIRVVFRGGISSQTF